MVDGVEGSRQIEQCKDSGVTTIDSIEKVREDLSNDRFSRVTGPEAGLVWRKKLVKGKIGDKLLGNETFQKLRDDRKVRDWTI